MKTSGAEVSPALRTNRRLGWHALAAAAGIGLALLLAWLPALGERDQQVGGVIRGDFAFDVSDPSLIAGSSSAIIVGRVAERREAVGDRTIFVIEVVEHLKGEVPQRLRVSQLGFERDGDEFELEGFPLMAEGETYIMGLVPPAGEDPPDALVVLSARDEGNLVQVTDARDARVTMWSQIARDAPHPDGPDDARAAEAAHATWLADQ